ncbi:aldehyde dehydrogenase family protein [Phytohabitans rumicis]|uniref:Aldehyde dehydrogenase n=1 Tax=Phytohabitans rumicis TaxID=1076125 RepID=A0A6V8LMB3_9ACTN|nr:aldehyde dehydrogenase family protein [Phytohabitans rumicis]GFJ96151.1 aldehyde dehydrogenase [Phytohabitans rumicis]
MTREVRHLIGGERVGTPTAVRENPARPGETVAVSAAADTDLAGLAVAAAQSAQPAWAATPAPARGSILTEAAALLLARADQVATDLTREEGKTLAEARGEVRRAVDILRFFGGEGWRANGQTLPSSLPDTFVYTKREPVGVVATITPWNFPIAIPAWKIAPALVSGNAVVLKPAELTPVSVWHLSEALREAGLPPGVLNVVYGDGAVAGRALVEDPRVGAVSFTGSVEVGQLIHAAVSARRARVQLEMGGKNPLVVLDDADPARAARIAAAGGYGLTGQACTATSRVICTPGIHDAFVDALLAEAARYQPGDGQSPGTLMGPVASAEQLAVDRSYLRIAADQGGQVLAGGAEPDGLRQSAAVVVDVKPDHRIATEEVFGPVIAVLRADDLDGAVAVANAVPFGLAAGIVTNDLRAAHRFADTVQAGVVKVNRPTSGLDLNVPFGGVKGSSTNTFREQGSVATEFYTWTKSVYMGVD